MKLHYFHDPQGNVGDDLNPWLWSRLLPGLIDDDGEVLIVGIGTLLNDELPSRPRKVILGAGAGYGRRPPVPDATWRVYAVRGPLTAAAIGLPARAAITDPAALVATLGFRQSPAAAGTAFMPHHVSADRHDWAAICGDVGIHLIDPRWPVDRVLEALGNTRNLLTEAMHGAILADALRVPWTPVIGDDIVLAYKWIDWCASLELTYRPAVLPARWSPNDHRNVFNLFGIAFRRGMEQIGMRRHSKGPFPPVLQDAIRETLHRVSLHPQPTLSDESVLGRACERLLGAVDRLRADIHKGLPLGMDGWE